jgi:hypothetical protein
LDEASGEAIEVWPDNVMIVNVFISMSTQWRVGMAGPTGLDYAVLPFVMRANGVPITERRAVFDGIRTMEDAALLTMRENKS